MLEQKFQGPPPNRPTQPSLIEENVTENIEETPTSDEPEAEDKVN
jgi:hypothetical protein